MNQHASKILVAEDNPGLAHVLRFNLEHNGLDVTVAMDGVEAWDSAQTESFDLVISDHEMPGISGVELLTRIRKLPEYTGKPLLMVTAKALELDTKRLEQQLDLAAVFSKPYSPIELVDTVQRLLSSAD
jgi:CheY-like chemotaxis protein